MSMDVTRKDLLRTLLFSLASGATVVQGQEGTSEEISESDLKSLEKIAGISFTDDERKQVLTTVRSNRRGFEAVRKLPIDFRTEPPTVFTTLAGGSRLDANVKVTPTRDRTPDVGRMSSGDIPFLSVWELAWMIKRRELSPVRLTDLYLDRLKRYGDSLLCVVTLTEDLAREQALRAEMELRQGKWRGWLHGIPYGLKDLFATKGIPTTWGAEPFALQVFDDNATVVRKLEEAGAVLCAKLSMGALAMNDVWFKGTTKNPWNPKQGSSGSSAGSGAAVAAGLVAFAIGTETLGSICSPSERCRVTGLRPTYGRISRAGGMALSYTMDKVGPMVRSAEDAALVLGELCGEDSADPSAVSRSFEWPAKMDWKKLKIGFLRWPDAPTEPEKAIESNVHLGRLQKFGATVVPVQFSPVSPIMQSILLVESSSAFDAFTRGDQVDSLKNSMWPQIFRAARYVPAVEYLQMQRARQLLMKQFEDEWGDLDLVIGPSIAASILLTTNLTGHPQIVLPQGDDGKGNSRSLSLIGRLFEEDKLLAVAIALQEADDFHRRRPNLNVF